MNAGQRLWRELTGFVCPVPITLRGAESVLAGPFRIETAAAAVIGVSTAAAALHRGEAGPVAVDTGRCVASFGSEKVARLAGGAPMPQWAPLSGVYRGNDGWIRLHCNADRHAEAVCRALHVAPQRAALDAAVAQCSVWTVQERVLAHGGAAAVLRSPADWASSAAGVAVRSQPLVAFDRIGDAAPRVAHPAPRVLELTHVIAGPTAGKVLAAHGADVLHVSTAERAGEDSLWLDTGFGKRSVFLDCTVAEERAKLRELAAGADVFVQSYRPSALAARGFGPQKLAELRPGIVYVELNAYGWTGPLAARRGFDSLVQLSTGIAAHAGTDEVRSLPVQALDHATGWLAAFAALHALGKQATEGGSWRVRLSLARTALWLDSLGRHDSEVVSSDGTAQREAFAQTVSSAFGEIVHVPVPYGSTVLSPPPVRGSSLSHWRER